MHFCFIKLSKPCGLIRWSNVILGRSFSQSIDWYRLFCATHYLPKRIGNGYSVLFGQLAPFSLLVSLKLGRPANVFCPTLSFALTGSSRNTSKHLKLRVSFSKWDII